MCSRCRRQKERHLDIPREKGKVHVVVVPNVQAETLMQEIQTKAKKGSVFHTNSFKSYNDLAQYGKHSVIDHSKELVNGHITLMALKASGVMLKNDFTSIMELIK